GRLPDRHRQRRRPRLGLGWCLRQCGLRRVGVRRAGAGGGGGVGGGGGGAPPRGGGPPPPCWRASPPPPRPRAPPGRAGASPPPRDRGPGRGGGLCPPRPRRLPLALRAGESCLVRAVSAFRVSLQVERFCMRRMVRIAAICLLLGTLLVTEVGCRVWVGPG